MPQSGTPLFYLEHVKISYVPNEKEEYKHIIRN